jgi:hypothetical protein
MVTRRHENLSSDPWHRLPVRKLLGGVFSVADFTLPHGRVIKSY